ncbi:MAG: pyruvate dehydrogenase complex E1 component subunit beta [Alphaproteobacteria bacterium]
MPIEVLMPALSPTMTEGTVAKWLKDEGERVAAGDVIAEIETDKATLELEAVDSGVLARRLVPAGAKGIKVNQVIALLAGEDEDVKSAAAFQPQAAAAALQPQAAHDTPGPAQARGPRNGRDTPLAAKPVPVAAPPPADVAYVGQTVTQTMREALRDAMAEEMRRDSTVFLMGEEVGAYQGAYKVSQGLLDEFGPRRVVDTPITEHGFAGLGVGAAFGGLKPIVEFMTFNFAMQAIDHIINSAAKTLYMSGGQMRCPIVFRGPNGAAARVAAQHSQCYASWYAHVPGLKVVAPATPADAKGLLKAAIRDPNPVIVLENEILYGRTGEVPTDPDHVVPIGKARIVRPGRDATVVAFSIMVEKSLAAAEILAKDGIEIEVIDLRSLRPLDVETVIESVKRTNRCVSVEEGWPVAGIGSEIAALLMEQAFDWLDAPMVRVAGADVPLPYAANLEALALPQPHDIVEAVRQVMQGN